MTIKNNAIVAAANSIARAGNRNLTQMSLRERMKMRETALLMDISGSMGADVNDEHTSIDILRDINHEIMDENPSLRRFVFSTDVYEIDPSAEIPDPQASTNLAGALNFVKESGIRHVILITDGHPDSAELALRAADGLRIDTVYAGPDPMPEFMTKLGKLKGNSTQKGSFKDPEKLTAGIVGLLKA